MLPSGSISRADAGMNEFQLAARRRVLRQKLYVTMAATCMCAALVALLGDDSGYQKHMLAVQQLDDSTASTTGQHLTCECRYHYPAEREFGSRR
eukprot:2012737-Rhodomonas_salina.2